MSRLRPQRNWQMRNLSLNMRVRGLSVSPTLEIQERVHTLRSGGQKIYNFGLGQSPFPVPTPVVESLRLHASRKDYLPVAGLAELRQAVAEYHRKKDQVEASAQGVLIGPGSKELLFLLQLTFYGEIIVPSPCWVSYPPQAKIVGRECHYLPMLREEEWKLNPDALANHLESEGDRYRPRLLVLNCPANPTGQTYTPDELQAIAKVAREYEVIVLSDEIYSGLHHQGMHVSLARYYPEGTIILNGLSKWAGAGGWRLGTFTFPAELAWLREAMATVASETYTSVSTPIQYAAVRAFQMSMQMERYLVQVRRILRTLGRDVHRRLTEGGVDATAPGGAFYLFPTFEANRQRLEKRGIHTGEQLCNALLEEAGVALLPGNAFARDARELSARLSYVDFDGAQALATSEEVAADQELPREFLEARCGLVLEGVDQLTRWLNEES